MSQLQINNKKMIKTMKKINKMIITFEFCILWKMTTTTELTFNSLNPNVGEWVYAFNFFDF